MTDVRWGGDHPTHRGEEEAEILEAEPGLCGHAVAGLRTGPRAVGPERP